MRRAAPYHLPSILRFFFAASVGASLLAAAMPAALAGIDARSGVDDAETCAHASGEPAIAACTRAIASGRYASSELATLHYDRAIEYANKGDNDRAIADFDAAILLDPTSAAIRNDRGVAWLAKSEYDRALADFSEAIRLDPNDADYYNNRGSSWHLKGDDDRAIVDYDEAIRRNSKDPCPF
jgi:tetratricopeptide (TPR) repeat protein